MDRTVSAALLAGLIAFAAVAGTGVFLGFGTSGSLISGAVLGALAALLLWGASRRAATFHEPTPPSPRFPGPPDHPEPDTDDPTDAAPPSEGDAPDGDDQR